MKSSRDQDKRSFAAKNQKGKGDVTIKLSNEDCTLSGRECESLLKECFPELYNSAKKKSK